MPLGNGRLGMMPDGGIAREQIVLNEVTMWSGSNYDYSNPQANASLPEIRNLLMQGKNLEAQKLLYDTFLPEWPEGNAYGYYEMLGNLILTFLGDENGEISNYERRLSLPDGIATTTFKRGESTEKRSYFCSRTDDVDVMHLQTKDGKLNFDLTLTRPARSRTYTNGTMLLMNGELDSGQPNVEGVCYLVASGINTDGEVITTDSSLQVRNATEATIIVSAATSYGYKAHYGEEAIELLEEALKIPYNTLKERHKASHAEYYSRLQSFIGDKSYYESNESPLLLPTDERIVKFQEGNDPALASLYLQYARYLFAASTRQGYLPPNLQGLWANDTITPWCGDFHLNINVQMNHWLVEPGNLSDLYEPLIALTESLQENGTRTAKSFYGQDAEGWVAHMMTNAWQFTEPGFHPEWGATNTGGAWLCAHLWEHYDYSGDTAYLARVYPTMREAARFFLSTMVVEPKHGWLVTAPTSSPENSFYMPDDASRSKVSICMGPTMDTQLIRELFSNVVMASELLNQDDSLRQVLHSALAQLPDHKIAEGGYLQEWLEDYEEAELNHRHVSHLYGLHPSNQISPITTPELAKACRVTLNRRGDEATGWSRAWKINFWARLHDGNRAWELFKSLLKSSVDSVTLQEAGAGTYPNLFCSHPPFQIDGNFGGAAGIMEMLLQSHAGFIHFLPALPDNWNSGYIHGIKARRNITTNIDWNEQEMSATFSTPTKQQVRIYVPQQATDVTINGKTVEKRDFMELELLQIGRAHV